MSHTLTYLISFVFMYVYVCVSLYRYRYVIPMVFVGHLVRLIVMSLHDW